MALIVFTKSSRRISITSFVIILIHRSLTKRGTEEIFCHSLRDNNIIEVSLKIVILIGSHLRPNRGAATARGFLTHRTLLQMTEIITQMTVVFLALMKLSSGAKRT